jgi:hypothetical protein
MRYIKVVIVALGKDFCLAVVNISKSPGLHLSRGYVAEYAVERMIDSLVGNVE